MLATAAVLSVVLGLLAKPHDFGIDNTLTLGMIIFASTFGAHAFFSGDFPDDDVAFDGSAHFLPLTATVITFAVGVVLFRWMVRNYPRALPAFGDAVRVAVMVAVPLCVGSLVFRSDIDELGGGWITDLTSDIGDRDTGTWGASAVGALFVPFILVVFVLALACLSRRDWWSGRWRTVAEWVAPALHGLAVLAASLPICGLIGLGLLMFGPDDDSFSALSTDEKQVTVAAIAAGLGNGGPALLALGSGAELGYSGEVVDSSERAYLGLGDSSDSSEEYHRLAWYAGDDGDEPALWASPIVLLGVLAATAWWVAGRSRERSHVLRNLAVWCGLLLVAVPLSIRLAALHGGGEFVSGSDSADASGYIGPAGGQATTFILLIAVVLSVVVAFVRGGIDPAQFRALAGRFQTNPGSGPPPPPPPPPPPYRPNG